MKSALLCSLCGRGAAVLADGGGGRRCRRPGGKSSGTLAGRPRAARCLTGRPTGAISPGGRAAAGRRIWGAPRDETRGALAGKFWPSTAVSSPPSPPYRARKPPFLRWHPAKRRRSFGRARLGGAPGTMACPSRRRGGAGGGPGPPPPSAAAVMATNDEAAACKMAAMAK